MIYIKNQFNIDNDKKYIYLEKYKKEPKTYDTYYKVLLKIDDYEKKKNKTLFEMDITDIKEFLSREKSILTINSYSSVWKGYLELFKAEHEKDIGYISVNQITKTLKNECINRELDEKQYITKKEYYELLNNTEGNAQDKVLIVLLWHQIMGKEYIDIRNIRKENINFATNSINVGDLEFYFEDIEMDVIKFALTERKCKLYNKKDKKITYIDYLDNGYLLKPTLWSNTKYINAPVNKSTFQDKFANYTNNVLMRPELNGKSIYASGIFYIMLLKYKGNINYSEIIRYLEENRFSVAKSKISNIKEIMKRKMEKESLYIINNLYVDNNDEIYSKLVIEVIKNNNIIIEVAYDNINIENDDEEFLHITGREGEKKYYLGKRFERNKILRDIALRVHGFNCCICGFNFETVYAQRGKNFIEVHHKTPLYKTGKVVVNAMTDLVVVCSNCHRIIHRYKNIVIEIDQLIEIVKNKISL